MCSITIQPVVVLFTMFITKWFARLCSEEIGYKSCMLFMRERRQHHQIRTNLKIWEHHTLLMRCNKKNPEIHRKLSSLMKRLHTDVTIYYFLSIIINVLLTLFICSDYCLSAHCMLLSTLIPCEFFFFK